MKNLNHNHTNQNEAATAMQNSGSGRKWRALAALVALGLVSSHQLQAQTGVAAGATSTAAKAAAQQSMAKIAAKGFGTFVSGAIDVATLCQQIHSTLNSSRSGVITIENQLPFDLIEPKIYTFSGGIQGFPGEISAKPSDPTKQSVGVIGVKNSSGATAGAVGVVTYQVKGQDFRLAICYSIPYDYNLYENWFKFQIITKHTPTDHALYEDMYYNYGKKTLGRIAPASGGSAKWINGYRMSGTMGTTGKCELKLTVKPL